MHPFENWLWKRSAFSSNNSWSATHGANNSLEPLNNKTNNSEAMEVALENEAVVVTGW
jgi:hypothetical protein